MVFFSILSTFPLSSRCCLVYDQFFMPLWINLDNRLDFFLLDPAAGYLYRDQFEDLMLVREGFFSF